MRFFLVLSIMALAACSHTPQAPEKEAEAATTIVLIHGSHFDGSVWDQVKSHLGDKYPIITPTLLGRSEKESPTLHAMAEDVCSKIPERSVVVGHSFGGAVINEMVGACPSKIKRIIYVTAIVPLSGEKPFEVLDKEDEKTYGTAVKFGKTRIAPKSSKVFLKAMDATLDSKKLPKVKLYSEALSAGAEPLTFDDAVYSRIPKLYIFATEDKIITLKSQKRYVARTSIGKTGEITSGHLPLLSRPQELAQAILQSF